MKFSTSSDGEGCVGADLYWLLLVPHEQYQVRDQQGGRVPSAMSLESALTFTDVLQKEVSVLNISED